MSGPTWPTAAWLSRPWTCTVTSAASPSRSTCATPPSPAPNTASPIQPGLGARGEHQQQPDHQRPFPAGPVWLLRRRPGRAVVGPRPRCCWPRPPFLATTLWQPGWVISTRATPFTALGASARGRTPLPGFLLQLRPGLLLRERAAAMAALGQRVVVVRLLDLGVRLALAWSCGWAAHRARRRTLLGLGLGGGAC